MRASRGLRNCWGLYAAAIKLNSTFRNQTALHWLGLGRPNSKDRQPISSLPPRVSQLEGYIFLSWYSICPQRFSLSYRQCGQHECAERYPSDGGIQAMDRWVRRTLWRSRHMRAVLLFLPSPLNTFLHLLILALSLGISCTAKKMARSTSWSWMTPL